MSGGGRASDSLAMKVSILAACGILGLTIMALFMVIFVGSMK